MKKIHWSLCSVVVFSLITIFPGPPVLAADDTATAGDVTVDQDADGVADAFDICPGTVLGVLPTSGATKNRFYATEKGTFIDGRGTLSKVTVASAGGCSGQQIIEAGSLSSTNERYGLWGHYLDEWADLIEANSSLENDDDRDGVLNEFDLCPATVLGIKPSIELTKNRFYANVLGVFVDGRGTLSKFTIAETGGCSGQQIIDLEGHSSSNERYGLWADLLAAWVSQVDVDATVVRVSDSDNDGVSDDMDLCPGTILGVLPTQGVAENRFYNLTTGAFVDGLCRVSDVTVTETGGCSAQQIVNAMGLGNDDLQFGLWEDSLLDWVDSIN